MAFILEKGLQKVPNPILNPRKEQG